ncbi:MAG: TetR/AcrR family transcriptional regulator [Clostridia bacterium]|jgi:AcrR family transcriptional regulator|nr:TetR/AcrR family transcriptional regulator [Clostridia bacterium]
MSTKKLNTLERIHKAAKGEFLEKGFQAASLRNIVKKAGVTTGAFYGYYNSKEELFDALVSYFEMIIHEMPREQAKNYVKQLWEFQTAGWSKIMGI